MGLDIECRYSARGEDLRTCCTEVMGGPVNIL